MFQSKEERLSALTKLIEKFSQNEEEYKKSDYKEAKLRTDFLNPFFKILDWDIENAEGKSEKYRDVIIEDRIEISGSRRAPDFCFRIGGQPKFYVEAKKPFVNIESEIAPSLQLRRYGHSAILPLSILTDFEEFAVYDTSIKPRKNDKASAARIMLIKYKDYVKEFDFLYGTFSRGAIEGGSFDKYAEGSKNKRGTDSIDRGLLELVENARLLLAKSISKLNEIGADYLNEAVIKIIDMTIFLKLAEDKGVENYEALLKAAQSDNLCVEVNKLFEAADERYNSGLFGEKLILKDINKEAPPSSQVKSLFIEPKILKEIIESFYFPECPYEFSVLPVSILGNIYEQFLGQTIRQTASGIIKIEEKPEVRKAGGVYYTPEYIVDYIIKNTVGEKIGGKTPKEIGAVKILDPACGSGSFLIRAYQFLLDYHLDYYQQPSRQAASLKQGLIKRFGVDSFRLSISEKQRILTNNIFGVDIDAQAAETAKFSLLIKLMETETRESVDELFNPASIESKKGMKVLPDLDGNIKCGNSLIDKDFYLSEFAFADNETIKKVNPFSWEETFPDIMKSGGFDCIVGNPPYVSIRNQESSVRDFIRMQYHYSKGADLYVAFFEKGFRLLKKDGYLTFITPNKFFAADYGKSIREFLRTSNIKVRSIWDIKDEKVFSQALISTIVISFANNPNCDIPFIVKQGRRRTIKNLFDDKGRIQIESDSKSKNLIKSISNAIALQDIADIRTGIMGFEYWKMSKIISGKKDKNSIPILVNGNFSRYSDLWETRNVSLYKADFTAPYIKLDAHYLNQNTVDLFKQYPKIIVRGVAKRVCGIIDNIGYAMLVGVHSIISKSAYNNLFLLGIINSKFINWYHLNTQYALRIPMGSLKYPVSFFKGLPIPKIDGREKEVAQIIKLVNLMIEIQTKLQLEQNPKDKEIYQNKADILDKKIDAIVYDLYGLTEKEIAVIEKN